MFSLKNLQLQYLVRLLIIKVSHNWYYHSQLVLYKSALFQIWYRRYDPWRALWRFVPFGITHGVSSDYFVDLYASFYY